MTPPSLSLSPSLTVSARQPWLVFTDLDGTLLDHHDYSHQAALPALEQLAAWQVPVILNSSKTAAELSAIAQALALDTPQIAENGSVIAYPDSGHSDYLGHDYSIICQVLDTLREQQGYQFVGFHDWNPQQIATATGLSLTAAARAGQRQASEPLIWQDEDSKLEYFRHELQQQGLVLKRGGRFWHVMGQTDKVRAMHYLTDLYQNSSTAPLVSIALGDGPNDREMLAAADIAVRVSNPQGSDFELTPRPGQQLIHTRLPGPAGWNEAFQQLFAGRA